MERDNGSPIRVSRALFEGNMAAFLAEHNKTSASQCAYHFATRDGREVPTHAPISMLVR